MTRSALKPQGIPTLLGVALLSLLLCPSRLAAQQRPSAPTCDVHLDLQYELQKTAHVTLAGQMEVAPPVVQVIMGAAGEDHWNEVTKHGKKYPGICRDDEHLYYVLVWKVTDYDATAELDVLDDGCLVYPPVFGSNWISRNREKAIKKVFEDTLRSLAANGKQPAPTPLTCNPPEMLGPTKYKLKALKDICKEHRLTYTEACRPFSENAAVSPETTQPPAVEPEARLPQPGQSVSGNRSDCTPAIESEIAGEFNGWDGESVFKLTNGQIWEQAEYDYEYEYDFMPEVIIYPTNRGCRMKVEGVDSTILVRRVK